MSTCSNSDTDNVELSFMEFSKTLLKTFMLLVILVIILILKKSLLRSDSSLFYIALFVIFATFLFTLLGVMDKYLYNNLVMGMGIAVGLQLLFWTQINISSK
tara:strand:+ start:289 stop:594 length:306 start_codon:yes stop_codon:yes gene_type:complete